MEFIDAKQKSIAWTTKIGEKNVTVKENSDLPSTSRYMAYVTTCGFFCATFGKTKEDAVRGLPAAIDAEIQKASELRDSLQRGLNEEE